MAEEKLLQVKFNNRKSKDFITELREEVDHFFTSRNLSTYGDYRMYLKTAILMTVYFGAYALILTNWFSPLQMLGLAIVLGMATAGIGFSVAHDAIHGAYSPNSTVNKWVGYSMNLIGGSAYIWSITHNVVHHTYTNIAEVDEDLEVAPFIRLSPHVPHKPIHRMQHIFAFIAYGFASIFWVFLKDYKKLMQKNLGPYQNKKHPKNEVVKLFAFKALYYTYIIIIPLLVLNITWWQFAIGFVVMHFTAGIILGVVFQLAHVVEETEHPQPDEKGWVDNSWAIHQMQTTSDFARSNKLLSWYVGGLNFQVVHHLFPKVCSIHYPEISNIIDRVAKKHNVTYHYHDTFFQAVGSHYRVLKKLGSGEDIAAHVNEEKLEKVA